MKPNLLFMDTSMRSGIWIGTQPSIFCFHVVMMRQQEFLVTGKKIKLGMKLIDHKFTDIPLIPWHVLI